MASKKKGILLLIAILILIAYCLNEISADCAEGQVNINNASIEELDLIKWVGNATAQAIIASRPFNSVDDLINVSGIGEIKLQDIKNQGLACVNSIPEEEEEEENNDSEDNESIANETEEEEKKFDNEPDIVIRVVSSNIGNNTEKPIKMETKVIELNTKDIKTENNKENLSKTRNYLLLGFLTFTMLIVTLISIKALNKTKQKENEFG